MDSREITILVWFAVLYLWVGVAIWLGAQYEEMRNGYIGGLVGSWKIIPFWAPYLVFSLIFHIWMENDNKM